MYCKLALSNVKKSFRDYAIYFLTLTFGICIFYIFNSIGSQQAVLQLSEAQSSILQVLMLLVDYISVFISVVLGFLILYANTYLMKRRKKELGVYLTLGMERSSVSLLLILETFFIGIFSLVVGLLLGIFISQGLSVVTARLFAVDMKEFTFIFSQTACLKSLAYFGVAYLVVMIFNTVAISRYKLIDLLQGEKKNEQLKMGHLGFSLIFFTLAVICLAVAYYLVLDNGLMEMNMQFTMSILLGVVGTFFFFLSLAGFLLRLLKGSKAFYYRGLNMFVLRQLNNKINTTFVSMTFICLMLFITITALCSGMAVSQVFTENLEDVTPFDISFSQLIPEEDKAPVSLAAQLKSDGIPLDELARDYFEVPFYRTNITYSAFFSQEELEMLSENAWGTLSNKFVSAIPLSVYNRILMSQGYPAVSCGENQFLLNCTFDDLQPYAEAFLANGVGLLVYGKPLKAASSTLQSYTLETQAIRGDMGTLIVPDDLLSGQYAERVVLNLQYQDPDIGDKQMQQAIETVYNDEQGPDRPYYYYLSKSEVYEQNVGLSAVMTYLAIYIGMVFLVASAAILALQQLSEAADNSRRYRLLKELGADPLMVRGALFRQILIYFMLPLSLAIVHSIFGIKLAVLVTSQFGHLDIFWNVLWTAIVFLVIYGAYFLATYLGCNNILKLRKNII